MGMLRPTKKQALSYLTKIHHKVEPECSFQELYCDLKNDINKTVLNKKSISFLFDCGIAKISFRSNGKLKMDWKDC